MIHCVIHGKFTYFQFSRNLLVEDMDSRHVRATAKLKESREFAKWAQKDREERLPPLTEEQRKQLHRYLELVAEQQPEVYPETQKKP